MRERIEAIGGTLAIESPRGRGTRIEVSLPMPVPAADGDRPAQKPAATRDGPLVRPAGSHA
jgi:two-component system sensor histidine kinase DesK